jgi:TRAP transporter 4TM/12TM fusion protein
MVQQQTNSGRQASDAELQDLVAQVDTGARQPRGLTAALITAVALGWALFQLYIASPLPFTASQALGMNLTLNAAEQRSIHLAFALFLAYAAYPSFMTTGWGRVSWGSLIIPAFLAAVGVAFLLAWAPDFLAAGDSQSLVLLGMTVAVSLCLVLNVLSAFQRGDMRVRLPAFDWLLAGLATYFAGYIFLNYVGLSGRPGRPIQTDIVVSVLGLLLLLEATRRALGPPLVVVASIFLAYVFFGNQPWLPEMLQHRGTSLSRAMSTMWLTSEGVFGVALGVSTAFVFLFVLFGSMLDRAGAGNFFIKLAFAVLGHLRGGPAKAAVLASMMTGLISGSSIANVVTTGTFTIPLMKRVGFSSEKAGAVEVGSSVNGQIMPPVMGAAAFLMVEYVGIPYIDVIRHAFLPALISYIALLYLVHLEAVRAGMATLEKSQKFTMRQALLRQGITVASIFIIAGVTYYFILGVRALLPGEITTPVLLGTLLAVYVALIWYASKSPDLELDDPNAPVVKLPVATEVLKTGLHYLLPLFVLVWFLMIERRSPGLSAFYAVCLLIVIIATQKPLKALFRGLRGGEVGTKLREGLDDLIAGLIAGSRNMIGIACATATAGIIVGTVTLTGIGQVMAEFVEFLSGGNIYLILLFTALISLVLGMGLPTTANYIVVSSLMAPVIVELGAANGILIPLIAAHLFVFYFGIMADVTPPVGLASFAAAAVSGGDPLKTGFTAFFYSLRTVLLPFIFVFNTDLLLIDVGWVGGITVFVTALIAMLLFAAATQGWFLTKSRLWESAALLLVAIMLLRPGVFLDQVQSPWQALPPEQLFEIAEDLPDDAVLRLEIVGPDFDDPDRLRERVMAFDLGPRGEPGEFRFEEATGLDVFIVDGMVEVEEPFNPNHPTARALANMDFYSDPPVTIQTIEVAAEQYPRQIVWIPAFLILALVWFLQARRGGDANPFTA